MLDDSKIIIVLIICVTIVSLVPIIGHYKFINNCVANGLSMKQCIGTAGYLWIK